MGWDWRETGGRQGHPGKAHWMQLTEAGQVRNLAHLALPKKPESSCSVLLLLFAHAVRLRVLGNASTTLLHLNSTHIFTP